jgi:hypothetical protein
VALFSPNAASSEAVLAWDRALPAGLHEVEMFPPPGVGEHPSYISAGVVDLTSGGPASNTTVFQIASLTKPFTANLILRLAERKQLGLDDAAKKWIDWLPSQYASVTIRQLSSHTSGVPSCGESDDQRQPGTHHTPNNQWRCSAGPGVRGSNKRLTAIARMRCGADNGVRAERGSVNVTQPKSKARSAAVCQADGELILQHLPCVGRDRPCEVRVELGVRRTV